MKLHVHKLLLPPRPFSVKLRDSSLFKVSNLPSRDSDDDFLPWLEKKAGVEISSKLYIGKSSYGRSLFASKRIETGDCILKVPYSVQISPDNLCPGFKTLLGGKVGNTSKLALVVMLQQRIGQKSDWAPYIRCLPKYCDVNCSIFWSRRELEMIQQSSVYQETLKHKAQIERDFLTIKSALGHFPEVGSITIMEFMHCYALVGSRAWGSIKGLSLIPFADFMNHDGVSEAIVVNNDDKQVSEVTADRVYAPHDEVVIRYGKFSNAALLLDFGFTIPNNIFDEVRIQMDIPLHDPLRQMKLETLETHCIPIGQQASGFDALGDSFLIKEIRSPKGNGKGLPQPLRALARVLCCTSRRELNDLVLEAAQNDGRLARRPLKNINREFKAHNILLSHINRLADGYSASVQSLSMAHSSSACTRFTHRKQMAMDLLTGELRVLKAASVWLKNYCESLMQQTIDVSGINH